MKIIYKQSNDKNAGTLRQYGFCDCYLKYISDTNIRFAKKEHHHTEFEIHIIKKGYHIYSTLNTDSVSEVFVKSIPEAVKTQ